MEAVRRADSGSLPRSGPIMSGRFITHWGKEVRAWRHVRSRNRQAQPPRCAGGKISIMRGRGRAWDAGSVF